jgi:PAS domain S-box-containing protein
MKKLFSFNLPNDLTDFFAYQRYYEKHYLKYLILLGLPLSLFLSIYNVIISRYFESVFALTMFIFMIGLLKNLIQDGKKSIKLNYSRILMVIFYIFLIYTIGISESLSRVPFIFIFPMMMFFATRPIEKIFWILAVSIFLIYFILFPELITTPNEVSQFKSKTLLVYLILSFIVIVASTILQLTIETLFKNQLALKEKNKNLKDQIEERKRAQEALKESKNNYQKLYEQLLEEVKERKKAQETIVKSEKKYRNLFENGSDLICIHDLEGNLLDSNLQYKKNYGWNHNDLMNINIKNIVPEKHKSKVKLYLDRIIKDGKDEGIFKIFKKSGQKILLEYRNKIIFDKAGKPKAVQGTARDISNRVIIENRLRKAEKMEAVGLLAGGIAHDFNNILSGIFGYSQLASIHATNPTKVKLHISKIVEGAQRATTLIQQILTFSRQGNHNKSPLIASDIVNEALSLIRSTIPTNIIIKEQINTDAMVLADSTQIHQIVMNLCTNAYHSMGNTGGTLTVKIDEVALAEKEIQLYTNESSLNYLCLEVRDTGSGISNDIIEKIFDPYFTTKKTGKGTGLGLSVVNGIVKKHNGFIKIKTKLGEGSKIQVFIPTIDKKAGYKSTINEQDSNLTGSEKIMLVDDETAILETSQSIFEQYGYNVSTFKDGKKALKKFMENPDYFDIIITDMVMPGLTGDKLSKEILNIRKEIPIILCSGYNEEFTESKAVKLGVKRYLMKPVISSDLLKHIRDLLMN